MRNSLDLDEHFVLTVRKWQLYQRLNTNISQQQIYGISVDAKSHNLLQSFFQLPICFLFYIFPTFPAISSSWKSPPYMCLSPNRNASMFQLELHGLFNSHFFKVFWPHNPKLGYPLLSFNSLLQHTVSCGFEFLDFCCFFVRVSMVYWSYLDLNWVMDLSFFFISSHFFQCFPWVSLLTWFSPKAKVPFLVVVIFMIPVSLFLPNYWPTPNYSPHLQPLFVLVSNIDSPRWIGRIIQIKITDLNSVLKNLLKENIKSQC